MDILGGGFWVEVRFKDYSPRSTYNHIYFEIWLWEVSVIYWERNPLNKLMKKRSVTYTQVSAMQIGSCESHWFLPTHVMVELPCKIYPVSHTKSIVAPILNNWSETCLLVLDGVPGSGHLSSATAGASYIMIMESIVNRH